MLQRGLRGSYAAAVPQLHGVAFAQRVRAAAVEVNARRLCRALKPQPRALTRDVSAAAALAAKHKPAPPPRGFAELGGEIAVKHGYTLLAGLFGDVADCDRAVVAVAQIRLADLDDVANAQPRMPGEIKQEPPRGWQRAQYARVLVVGQIPCTQKSSPP